MSIIYEALKKTQRNREYRSMPARERIAVRNLDWLDKGLVGTIFLLSFIILWMYIPHMVRHHAPLTAAFTAKAVTPVSQQAQAPVQQEAAIATNNLTLNGVLLSDSDKIALINNRTYHVGDNVEGLKIVSIEFDNVRLRKGHNLVTLRTAS